MFLIFSPPLYLQYEIRDVGGSKLSGSQTASSSSSFALFVSYSSCYRSISVFRALCLSRRGRFISVWTDGVLLFCFLWRRSLVAARLKRSVSSWLHNSPCGASMQKLITPTEGIKFSPVSVCRLDNYLNDTTVERGEGGSLLFQLFSAHPPSFN